MVRFLPCSQAELPRFRAAVSSAPEKRNKRENANWEKNYYFLNFWQQSLIVEKNQFKIVPIDLETIKDWIFVKNRIESVRTGKNRSIFLVLYVEIFRIKLEKIINVASYLRCCHYIEHVRCSIVVRHPSLHCLLKSKNVATTSDA